MTLSSLPVRGAGALAAATLVAAVAGCGGDGAAWSGPPPPAADGAVSVDGFDVTARSPLDTAAAFLRLDERGGATASLVSRTAPEGGDAATVTATFDGLLDDSVRAERYVLRLERQGAGTWRLLSAALSRRCQAGRGHRDFTPAPCV